MITKRLMRFVSTYVMNYKIIMIGLMTIRMFICQTSSYAILRFSWKLVSFFQLLINVPLLNQEPFLFLFEFRTVRQRQLAR